MSRPKPMSPFDGFGEMSQPRGYEPPPPPWPLGPDPRTPDCRHDWTGEWGQRGERQHQCDHCKRWIWERTIWPEVTSGDAGAHDASSGEVGQDRG